MNRHLVALGLVFALTLAGAAQAQAQSASLQPFAIDAPLAAGTTGCGKAFTKGLTLGTLTSSGVQRTYRLYIPASYVATKSTPLVLNFHGYGSNAKEQEAYSHLPKQADASGFITVAPDGLNNEWYIYGKSEPGYVDDFAFVSALIDNLSARLCVDAKRIFATGISNGAAFSSQMACKLNDRIAAIAPVAGEPFSALDCLGKKPVPIMAFHGTADALVPFNGGPSGRLALNAPPVRTNMLNWAKFNGCNLTLSTKQVAADVSLESYAKCKSSADTQLYVIQGGGHTWPGAYVDVPSLGPTTHSIDATALMWQFLVAHPKP